MAIPFASAALCDMVTKKKSPCLRICPSDIDLLLLVLGGDYVTQTANATGIAMLKPS